MSSFSLGFVSLYCLVATSALAVSVRSVGARGDGAADDTVAIQDAVNAGGTVEFPTGTYRLTRPIEINLERSGFIALVGTGTARVVMAGAGPAFHFVGTHRGSAAPSQFKPGVWERERAPQVDRLEIVGAHPEADGIVAQRTMQLTVTHVLIRETRHAIRLQEHNRNVLISACHLYHNRGAGVLFDEVNLHQTNITGSHISYNAGGGVVVRGGNVFNIHIGNCDLESNTSPESPPTANVLIDATGGILGEVAITGCTLQHGSSAPGSANIRMLGGGSERTRGATLATREGYVTITGNILSDVSVNVHLREVRGVTLTGNTFYLGAEHDLLVEDSSHVVVGPNNFTLSARYETSFAHVRGGVCFRGSKDCTLTGVHINGVRHHPAAIRFERCERINLSNATVLDCAGAGVELLDTKLSHVGGCLIRDDRDPPNAAPALVVSGGAGNVIAGNVLDRRAQIAEGTAASRDLIVIPRTAAGPAASRPAAK